jgi:hypothetical protein
MKGIDGSSFPVNDNAASPLSTIKITAASNDCIGTP